MVSREKAREYYESWYQKNKLKYQRSCVIKRLLKSNKMPTKSIFDKYAFTVEEMDLFYNNMIESWGMNCLSSTIKNELKEKIMEEFKGC